MLTGAITAVIVVAAIYLWMALKPTPAIDADFGNQRLSFTTDKAPAETFRIVSNVLPGDRHRVSRTDEERGRVLLEAGMTMSSYGYYYPIDISPAAGGGSTVTVGLKSRYPWQWGPIVRRQHEKANQAMVDVLKARLEAKRIA